MKKKLLPGLEFARRFELTPKEIIALIPFLDKPYHTAELAKEMGMYATTLHHTIQRLRMKQLLIFKDKDPKGNKLYEFNEIVLIPVGTGTDTSSG